MGRLEWIRIEVARGDFVRQWTHSTSLLRWQFHGCMNFLELSSKVKMYVCVLLCIKVD